MSRKFKTMDGNQAAAHVSYGFTEVARFTQSLHLPQCQNTLTNGLRLVVKHLRQHCSSCRNAI